MSISKTTLRTAAVAATLGVAVAGTAGAATLKVTITNNQASGGVFLTPLVASFHDGTFDPFNAGATASPEVAAIAEVGNAAPLIAANPGRNIGVITSPGGFPGAPVIDPGETASLRFNVNQTTDRFFSFLSMVIPSNDYFIGNDNASAYEVFDLAGAFNNIAPISIFGGDVWDAGSELSNNVGAAFNASGGMGTPEMGVVSLAGDLTDLLGQLTAAGTTINSVPGDRELLATIEISSVPVPAALPLMLAGLGIMGAAGRRRKQTA